MIPNIQTIQNMPWAMLTFILNMNVAPTNNLKFREAVQVALNMTEIMALATEGFYRSTGAGSIRARPYNAGDIGKECYNQHDIRAGQGAAQRKPATRARNSRS